MTPTPGAAHAAQPTGIALKREADAHARALRGRVLDLRAWSRLRFLLDVLVLYSASSAALFAAPTSLGTSDRLLATASRVSAMPVGCAA